MYRRIYLQLHVFSKKIEFSGYTIAALVIVLLSCVLRFFFIAHNWPEVNSDEGTVGLMALHIEHFKDFPVYFYSQGAIGALEAYVGALLFSMFGSTVLVLRFAPLLLFVPFLISMYLLTSFLYNRGLALLTLLLVSLGSDVILFREYAAQAGHGETPLFGALLVLAATRLALSSPVAESVSRWPWRRMFAYGVWGWLVGVALWNDPLALPFVLASGIFLLLFCWHELRYSILLSIVIGLIVGSFPMIIYSVTVPVNQGSLSVYGYLVNYSHPVASDSIFERFAASFLVTLPATTGATLLCSMTAQQAWPLTAQSSPQVMQCSAIHGVWALAIVVLWLMSVIMAIYHIRPLWRRMPMKAAAPEERRTAIIQGARLMLLGSVLLTFLLFVASVQSITGPLANSRYLIAFGVGTPAVLWPLWLILGSSMNVRKHLTTWSTKLLCAALLACYLVTLGVGTFKVTEEFPQVNVYTQAREELVSTLLHLHITHMYTEYWTCDLTVFLSHEQIVCSVLDEQLHLGVNRYTPYISIVAQDPLAAYVFPDSSPQAMAFAVRVARQHSTLHYHVISVDHYMIYQPVFHG